MQLRFDPDKIKIPVIFHNLKGYDSHFIIKKLGKNFNISVIAQNFEKYISFTIDSLKFIDSFQFMGSSLDRLVSNLTKESFKYTDQEFKDLDNNNNNNNNNLYLHYSGRIKKRTNIENKIIENL